MITDWTKEYENSVHIEDGDGYLPRWREQALKFRATNIGKLDVSYGAHERQIYDVFFPSISSRGCFVFVHGGYWMDLCKSDFSHLVNAALRTGFTCFVPSYRLAPEATIGQITEDIRLFLQHICSQYEGCLVLAGHSAGGHLITNVITRDNEFNDRIELILPISGLFDLYPLMKTDMNKTLLITESISKNNSPALMSSKSAAIIKVVVGANERPEFLRQSTLLDHNWDKIGVDISLHVIPNAHHFNVIDFLTRENGLDSYL